MRTTNVAKGEEELRLAALEHDKVKRRQLEITIAARRHIQLLTHARLPWWRRWFSRPEDIALRESQYEPVVYAWLKTDVPYRVYSGNRDWHTTRAIAYGVNPTVE